MPEKDYDVIIVGGGPAGTTAAGLLARGGCRVLLVEQFRFPRYAVGESLLPFNRDVFRELGVEEALAREGFQRKKGAVFGDARGERAARIDFSKSLTPDYGEAYQVPRGRFDQVLLEHALAAGAEHRQARVREVLFEGDRAVGVELAGGERLGADVVIDASGRQALIGRKRGLLEPDARLDSAAVFGLFEGVGSLAEAEPGDIAILAFDAGWFWFIPFADGRRSVGVVVDCAVYDGFEERSREAFFAAMVERAGGRVAALLRDARQLDGGLHVLRKFSRRARRFAGPGWVLVGDAAMFVDPVFSAGVHMAMWEAREVARIVLDARAAGEQLGPSHFRAYERAVHDAYRIFNRYIYAWYDPDFRRFFFRAPEDGRIVRTVTTILAGGVFDRELLGRGDLGLFALVYAYKGWRWLTAPLRRVGLLAAETGS